MTTKADWQKYADGHGLGTMHCGSYAPHAGHVGQYVCLGHLSQDAPGKMVPGMSWREPGTWLAINYAAGLHLEERRWLAFTVIEIRDGQAHLVAPGVPVLPADFAGGGDGGGYWLDAWIIDDAIREGMAVVLGGLGAA